jgi:hypothetical protein
MDRGINETQVKVHLHYMIGNHDWHYHLPDPAFNNLRAEIVEAFGSSNSPMAFSFELKGSAELSNLLTHHKVYAQHGDMKDSFNYNKNKGRDASSLADAFVVEILTSSPTRRNNSWGVSFPQGLRKAFAIWPMFVRHLPHRYGSAASCGKATFLQANKRNSRNFAMR